MTDDGSGPADFQLPAGRQQPGHRLALEVVDVATDQEPVEQGTQRIVLGQVVRGREEREQRQAVQLGPAAVDPLVEHREQVVQDRAVGVEELVQEDELGLGQHAGGDRGDGPLAEPHQVDRAEHLVRLGEAGQQVLEVPPLDRGREPVDQGRLGRPRRPVQEQVLARDDGQGDQVDHLIPADEPPLHHVDHLAAEPAHRLVNHRGSSPRPASASAADDPSPRAPSRGIPPRVLRASRTAGHAPRTVRRRAA